MQFGDICYFKTASGRARAAVLSTKGIVSLISVSRPSPLFMWRSSRTAANLGVLCGSDLLVSLVSWIAAILALLLWRKVSSSVIFHLIPFAFHCIKRRQLVGVFAEIGTGFILISPVHWSISLSSSAGIVRSATKGDLTSRESSEVLAIDYFGKWSGREEATIIRTMWWSENYERIHISWWQGWVPLVEVRLL